MTKTKFFLIFLMVFFSSVLLAAEENPNIAKVTLGETKDMKIGTDGKLPICLFVEPLYNAGDGIKEIFFQFESPKNGNRGLKLFHDLNGNYSFDFNKFKSTNSDVMYSMSLDNKTDITRPLEINSFGKILTETKYRAMTTVTENRIITRESAGYPATMYISGSHLFKIYLDKVEFKTKDSGYEEYILPKSFQNINLCDYSYNPQPFKTYLKINSLDYEIYVDKINITLIQEAKLTSSDIQKLMSGEEIEIRSSDDMYFFKVSYDKTTKLLTMKGGGENTGQEKDNAIVFSYTTPETLSTIVTDKELVTKDNLTPLYNSDSIFTYKLGNFYELSDSNQLILKSAALIKNSDISSKEVFGVDRPINFTAHKLFLNANDNGMFISGTASETEMQDPLYNNEPLKSGANWAADEMDSKFISYNFEKISSLISQHNFLSDNNIEWDILQAGNKDSYQLAFNVDASYAQRNGTMQYMYFTVGFITVSGDFKSETYKLLLNPSDGHKIDTTPRLFVVETTEKNIKTNLVVSKDYYIPEEDGSIGVTSNFTNPKSINFLDKPNTLNSYSGEYENKIQVYGQKNIDFSQYGELNLEISTLLQYTEFPQTETYEVPFQYIVEYRDEKTSEFKILDNNKLELSLQADEPYKYYEGRVTYMADGAEIGKQNILILVINKNTEISPALLTYTPRYFTKEVMKEETEGLVGSGENYTYGTIYRYESALDTTDGKLKIVSEFEGDGKVRNIDSYTYTDRIRLLENSNLTPKFTINDLKKYSNSENPVEPNLVLYSPKMFTSMEYKSPIKNYEDIYENKINLGVNDSSGYEDRYYLFRSFYDTETLNQNRISFLEIAIPKKMYFYSDTYSTLKEINTIVYNYNINDPKKIDYTKTKNYSEFDNYGKDDISVTNIEEYVTPGINQRKVKSDNVAIADINGKYIPFSASSSNITVKAPVVLSLYWPDVLSQRIVLDSTKFQNIYVTMKPTNEYKLKFETEESLKLYSQDPNYKARIQTELENYLNESIQEADFLKENGTSGSEATNEDLFNGENQYFFNKLGKTSSLTPFLKNSSIVNNNSINYFFAVKQNNIVFKIDKTNLVNKKEIEIPGEGNDKDGRFFLSNSNIQYIKHYNQAETSDTEGYYKLIEKNAELDSQFEEINNQYNFEKEEDEAIISPVFSTTQEAQPYFKNYFNTISNSLTVKENPELFSKYRLSKCISDIPQKANILSHKKELSYSTEEEEIQIDFQEIENIAKKTKKYISCDLIEKENSTGESLANLSKYMIEYNLVKVLPNISNLYKVSDNNVKKLLDSKVFGSNISETDVSENAIAEIALHGRVYNSLYTWVNTSMRNDIFYKTDFFNLKKIEEGILKNPKFKIDKLTYFTDKNTNSDLLEIPVLNDDMQSAYETSTANQEEYTLFNNKKIIDTKGQEKEEQKVIKSSDDIESAGLNYSEVEVSKMPMSILFLNKLKLDYKKIEVEKSFSTISSYNINEINGIITADGKLVGIQPIASTAQTVFYEAATGTKIEGTPRIFLKLNSNTDENITLTKMLPMPYIVKFKEKYFNKAENLEMSEKEYFFKADVDENFPFREGQLLEPTGADSFKKDETIFENKIGVVQKNNDIINPETITFDDSFYNTYPTNNWVFFPVCNRYVFELPQSNKINTLFMNLSVGENQIEAVPMIKEKQQSGDNIYSLVLPETNFFNEMKQNVIVVNNNNYLKNSADYYSIITRKPVINNPELRVRIEQKEKIQYKDFFDIKVTPISKIDGVEYTYENEVVSLDGLYFGDNSSNEVIFNDGKYLKNGNTISIKKGIKKYNESPSYKKERDSTGKVVDSTSAYSLYTETSDDINYDENYMQNALQVPVISQVKLTRDTGAKKIVIATINFMPGTDTEKEIFMKKSDGKLKSINELNSFLKNIPELKGQLSYGYYDKTLVEGKEYCSQFRLRYLINEKNYGRYIITEAKGQFVLPERLKRNKGFIIENTASKTSEVVLKILK